MAEQRYDPADGIVVNTLSWAQRGFDDFDYYATHLVPLALGLLAVAAGAAWCSHTLLVLGRFQQSRHSMEVSDYDESLLADPPAAPGN